ncbi:MAG: hypothetical protein JJT76_14315 [Clostridiaceae bacterium]|nr:hypothetical protein [Clostridiaceae bacterium]
MRKSRFKVRRQRKNHNYFFVLLFIIIIPLAAIFIGSKITQSVILPVLYSDVTLEDEDLDEILNSTIFTENEQQQEKTTDMQEENVEENKTLVEKEESGHIKTLPLSVYLIQIASVSDTTNIESLVAELNDNKLSNLIYKMDNSYKVYTLGLTERVLVESRLENVREFYPDAYISEIHLPSKRVGYSQDEEELAEDIVKDFNSLIEIMDKQSREWYNFIEKEGNLSAYKELLEEQKQIIASLTQTITDKNLPKGLPEKKIIEKMTYHQESNIKHSIEFMEDSDNNYRIHSLFLDSLFRMLEVIK